MSSWSSNIFLLLQRGFPGVSDEQQLERSQGKGGSSAPQPWGSPERGYMCLPQSLKEDLSQGAAPWVRLGEDDPVSAQVLTTKVS